MIKKIFYNESRVIILVLFLVSFFHFRFFPQVIRMSYDNKMLVVIAFLLLLGFLSKSYQRSKSRFEIFLNVIFISLFVCAFVNCVSCYIFRYQSVWVTFCHWAPIFLLYLYYPFKSLNLSIRRWESILLILFCIEMGIEIIQNLFPDALLFQMTSGNEKFLYERRVRVYGSSILYVGHLFALNKSLVLKEGNWKYWFLFILSLCLMILSGYRTVLVASILSFIIMVLRVRNKRFYGLLVSIVLFIFIFGVIQTDYFKNRISEVAERQQAVLTDDNVRYVTLNYYLNDYFKSPSEMIFGSGMVKRIVNSGSGRDDIVNRVLYESKYSRDVSMISARYHIYPIDWGIIGFSWEAGIPAALLLVTLLLYLLFRRIDESYYYLSLWGLFALIISSFGGSYYSSPNLIYTSILLVILDKVLQKENKKTTESVNLILHR